MKTPALTPQGQPGRALLPARAGRQALAAHDERMPRSTLVIWVTLAALVGLLTWASLFELDEVTTGTGKVVPSSREDSTRMSPPCADTILSTM